jgi:hypothetical protein
MTLEAHPEIKPESPAVGVGYRQRNPLQTGLTAPFQIQSQ